jgi:hypothetical protein
MGSEISSVQFFIISVKKKMLRFPQILPLLVHCSWEYTIINNKSH